MAVADDHCRLHQTFHSTSPTAACGSSCGGYAIAFGPSGAIDPTFTSINLAARRVGLPPTQAHCDVSTLAAVGWGYRCKDAACARGTWEVIAGPQSTKGS